jgi:hypothetical protein
LRAISYPPRQKPEAVYNALIYYFPAICYIVG